MAILGPRFVEELRKESEAAGLSLEQLCRKSRGVPMALLLAIEQGRAIPSTEDAHAIRKTIRRALGKAKRVSKSGSDPYSQARERSRGSGLFYDGRHFDSQLEVGVYKLIRLREAAKELELVQCQDSIYLTLARVRYIPDFKCKEPDGSPWEFRWIEAKGFEGPRWPTIVRLWRWYGPGPLEIWRGSGERPTINYRKDLIIPKRPWAQIRLELNGECETEPDIEAG